MCLYTKQLEQLSNANENSLTFIVGEKGLVNHFLYIIIIKILIIFYI